MGRSVANVISGMLPVIAMMIVQMIYAGLIISYELALNDGMSKSVLIAYRSIFATAFLAPIALVVEWKSRPKLTWMVTMQAFLCGLFGGSLNQNLVLESMTLTSPTFVSAINNFSPAFTFIIATIFRLESANIRKASGRAKIIGTLICIAGAMVITFYKGKALNILTTNINLLGHHNHDQDRKSNNVLGLIVAVIGCFCYALWLIIQAKMNQNYPCYYSSATLVSFMASIQSVFYALCTERNHWAKWKLGLNVRLYASLYMGVFGSGFVTFLVAWGIARRGPLFASIFTPLHLILVSLASPLLLAEKLHVGSIIGGAVIIIGLYLVLWGKQKDGRRLGHVVPARPSMELQEAETEAGITSISTRV